MGKRFDPEFVRRAFAELNAQPRTRVTLGKSATSGRSIKVDIAELSIYIVGKPGTGKSTLQARLFLENQDHSKILIDPQGKMTKELILPKIKDPEGVIYFCPAEQWDRPLGFNPFDMGRFDTPFERDLLADNLQQIFAHLWVDSFKSYPNMAMVFRNALQVMVRIRGSTFLDMARFLIDKDFRQDKLKQIDDRDLYRFWTRHYTKDMGVSSYNKVDSFVSNATIRRIVCQRRSSFHLGEAMEEGRTILLDLGGLGENAANLLGGLVVSQVLSAIRRRMREPTESLKPFAIFVDEFQRFGGRAFETIITECRQQRSSVCIAHQYLGQLDHRMQKAVRQCAYLVCFEVDADTNRALREEFAPGPDLGHLPRFYAWVKIDSRKKGEPPKEEEVVTRKLEKGDLKAFAAINEMAKRRYGRPLRYFAGELDAELEEVQRRSYGEQAKKEAQEGSKEPISAKPSEPESPKPDGLRPLGPEDHRLAKLRHSPSAMPPRLARRQRDKLREQDDSVSEGV